MKIPNILLDFSEYFVKRKHDYAYESTVAADVSREAGGGGLRVSSDRELSSPSASLVNYIVGDPISVFTVH